MSDNTEETTTTERGSLRPVRARRDLPATKGIEIRDSGPDIMRGGAGATARHGNVLAGGVPDPDRRSIVVESVGNSGANANRVLHSDHADGGIGIPGGRPATEIAIEQRSRLHGEGVYERTPATTTRRDLTDDERLAALRRRVPESMVIEEGARQPQRPKTEAERAAELRQKLGRHA